MAKHKNSKKTLPNLILKKPPIFITVAACMYLELLLLLIGFLVLIAGAFFLVRGASSVARRYNISGAIIGLVVIGFGTSMPELVVTVYGTMQGQDDLIFANIIGSNIFTVLFVLGIAAIVSPLIIQRNTVRFEIPLSDQSINSRQYHCLNS